MWSPAPPLDGRRIVVCDYDALLLSVAGVLRLSGYRVFRAHDGRAARELCALLPDIALLVINSAPSLTDATDLVRHVRGPHPRLAILHIGAPQLPNIPDDIPTLTEPFTPEELLRVVRGLLPTAR